VGRPDVLVSVSPSFPALAPAIAHVKARRIPWVLWLQDLLPEAAVATGLLKPGLTLSAASKLEMRAYDACRRIVTISQRHAESLTQRGVPNDKLSVITNPATLAQQPRELTREHFDQPTVICLGNIGLSQGLVPLTRAFEASEEMARRRVRLRFAGDGVQADAVRAEIRSDRVRVLGIIPDTIESELSNATVGLLGQLPETGEFNMPSRLMNLMGHGIPVIAAVSSASEVARIIREAEAGWTVDPAHPAEFPRLLDELLTDEDEIRRRGASAFKYANHHFTPRAVARQYEEVLAEAIGGPGPAGVL
jgi:colanic acid biosynthesis glycosyl transferase WcaI